MFSKKKGVLIWNTKVCTAIRHSLSRAKSHAI